MSEPAERVAVSCPSCSPAAETAHEVLRPGGQATVRCGECGHVHKTRIERSRSVERDVVVSQEGESFTATVDVPEDERLATGEEFVLDTEEAIMTVRITSLEVGDERREEAAPATEVDTIWTRAVGNVGVDVTLHPSDGRNRESRSERVYVPGDHEFVVGETETVGETTFTVEGIHLRDDAGYGRQKLDHEGDAVLAKDVNRLYGRDESTGTAWSAW